MLAIGVGGSVGFRLVERYYTDLHAITRDFIEKTITFDQAIERIRSQLSLNLFLTAGKLVSDIATVGVFGKIIYELINGLPKLIEQLVDGIDFTIDSSLTFIEHFFPTLADPSLHPNYSLINDTIDSIFLVGIIDTEFDAMSVLERALLTFTRWIFKKVQEVGSFFYTEAMKYYLVVLALFYDLVEKCRRFRARLINMWHRIRDT